MSGLTVEKILDMLDWSKPLELQNKGIALAKNISSISSFIQPVTPKHNKNVWENCSIILSERKDEELQGHLVELMEWLQDMNWPGSITIFNRLKNYSDYNIFYCAYNVCLQKARDIGDNVWEENLNMLIRTQTQGDGTVVLTHPHC